ncbi:polysaccharide deacetylase family protein [Pseudonocardia acidicola]|uniref:Polysaccharide deacetylase family protein n=1 Tax=Pseudonocardia acidicola TaxID=2724939 RepID=A0ABX1SG61_9PSEU|nr:polysaccharide deacetylase family protein [Pseudonocardia acidicola]NMH99552.1 polysaccharide deacetylase family protein [Pseudonocardia acidicola]
MDHQCPARTGLSRRAFLGMLGVGAAAVVSGCAGQPDGLISGAPGLPPAGAGPGHPAALPPVPAARPGPTTVLRGGPTTGSRIALTVDDGTCADCVAGYAEFAQRTGVHITFSPNGTYAREWQPHTAALRPLVAAGQVQIMNHTFSHPRLTKIPEAKVREELERNDEWVVKNFGITTRPYYRPPYGLHNPAVDAVAGGLGFTRTVLWDGSYSDSTVITPDFLMSQARLYLKPGVIMLGHANHPTVLGLFDQIMALIKERQLQPVTLDEMFGTSRAVGA